MNSKGIPDRPLRLALLQVNAGRARADNLAWIESALPAAGECDLIALPEVCAMRGGDDDYRADAEPLDGPLAAWFAAQARGRRAWLLAGSMPERAGGGIFNTSLLFDPSGRRVAAYRKMHLFEARLDDGRTIRESDLWRAGDQPVLAEIAGWRCGLSICYDLRFPELFRYYAERGAHLLCLPSNFTQRTGRDHWEMLLRARAIENQAFVAAPAQCGANPASGIESYGHSAAIGPWGEVLAMAGDSAGVTKVTLDPVLLQRTRARVPALQHRRFTIAPPNATSEVRGQKPPDGT